MSGLLDLLRGLAIVASSLILISFAAWLISDADFTYKMCVQYPGVYFLTLILSVMGNVAYFTED